VRILGIDPGTSCGYAIAHNGDVVASGVWDLSARRHEGGGMRFLRLETYLRAILAEGIDAVAYEEVRSHTRFFAGRASFATDAAHIYGGIVAIISSTCESWVKKWPEGDPTASAITAAPIPYRGIPVGTIKKFATGRGNASKEEMLEAAAQRWPEYECADDNEADARFIALTLAKELNQGVSSTPTKRAATPGARKRKSASTPPHPQTYPTSAAPVLPTFTPEEDL